MCILVGVYNQLQQQQWVTDFQQSSFFLELGEITCVELIVWSGNSHVCVCVAERDLLPLLSAASISLWTHSSLCGELSASSPLSHRNSVYRVLSKMRFVASRGGMSLDVSAV